MFEFLSSPFGLVAVGLGVLAVAVLALCLWITTLDRRMRGMADGLEAERRKVAEMQMVIGRRNNAARSYGGRPRAGQPAPQAAPRPAPAAGGVPIGAPQQGMPMGHPGMAGAPAATATAVSQPAVAPASRPAPQPAPRPAPAPRPTVGSPTPASAGRAPQGVSRRRGGGWAPDEQLQVASEQMAEAWVQSGGFGQQPIVVPDKKMSRKARREAERAFAARAAAELEARQARRAAEAASAAPPARSQGQQGIRPYGGPAAPTRGSHAPAPVPGTRPVARGGSGFPDQYGAPAGAPQAPLGRGRHAR